MKSICTLILALICISSSAQNFKNLKKVAKKTITQATSSNLSEEEVAQGLKEALTIGVEKGVDKLAKTDGFLKDPEIKITFPEEVIEVENKLRKMGQGEQVDKAVESINRAAEDAVIDAKDIFIAAIKNMTLTDVLDILSGDEDAATRFLEKSTRAALVEKFKPTVKSSLDKVGATKHWNLVITNYNKVPFVTKVNPDLVDYVTNKTIDGLFIQIAKEEALIRHDPAARVTDLLKKVFES